jgi:hypothetical protein
VISSFAAKGRAKEDEAHKLAAKVLGSPSADELNELADKAARDIEMGNPKSENSRQYSALMFAALLIASARLEKDPSDAEAKELLNAADVIKANAEMADPETVQEVLDGYRSALSQIPTSGSDDMSNAEWAGLIGGASAAGSVVKELAVQKKEEELQSLTPAVDASDDASVVDDAANGEDTSAYEPAPNETSEEWLGRVLKIGVPAAIVAGIAAKYFPEAKDAVLGRLGARDDAYYFGDPDITDLKIEI